MNLQTVFAVLAVVAAQVSARRLLSDEEFERHLQSDMSIDEEFELLKTTAIFQEMKKFITTESRSDEESDADARERYKRAKVEVAALNANSTGAIYSVLTPHGLMNDKEFSRLVGQASEDRSDEGLMSFGNHDDASRRLEGSSDDSDIAVSSGWYSPSQGQVHPYNGQSWSNTNGGGGWSYDFNNGGGWKNGGNNGGNNPRQNGGGGRAPCPSRPPSDPVAPDMPWPSPSSRPASRVPSGPVSPDAPQPTRKPSGPVAPDTPYPSPAPNTRRPSGPVAPETPYPSPSPNTRRPSGPVAPDSTPSSAPGPAPGPGPQPSGSGGVNWADKGCVTAVRNQGSCGSCWAFAAVAAVESGLCVKGGKGACKDLSDQEVLGCSTGSSGCNGGVPYYGLQYVQKKKALCPLESMPYKSAASCGSCSSPVNIPIADVKSLRPTGNPAADEAALQEAIRKTPVVVALSAGNSAWKYYKGGVITAQACGSARADHAVLAYGFTDKEYLIKNSWGTGWGEQGHVRVAVGSNACQITSQSAYPVMS